MKLYIPIIIVVIIALLIGIAFGVGFVGINQWNCRQACAEANFEQECAGSGAAEACMALRKAQCRASCNFI